MTGSSRPFELFFDQVAERRNPRKAQEGEVLRRVRRAVFSAGADSLPIDLGRLATHLRVSAVRDVPLAMDGRIVREGHALVVELNHDLSPFQRRFTLAHELAHLIIGGHRIGEENCLRDRNYGHGLSHTLMEYLCDWSAEELVAPHHWLREQIDPRIPSLATVRELARKIDCPSDFLATRILRLSLWPASLYWCERTDRHTRILKTFPPNDQKVLEDTTPLQSESSPIEACFRRHEYAEGDLDMVSAGKKLRFRAQCLLLSSELVLAMRILPS